MTLNNWIQSRYRTTKYLTWEAIHVGSQDSGQWTMIARCQAFMSFAFVQTEFYLCRIVKGVEEGRGTDNTKGSAAEFAANQALVSLRGY